MMLMQTQLSLCRKIINRSRDGIIRSFFELWQGHPGDEYIHAEILLSPVYSYYSYTHHQWDGFWAMCGSWLLEQTGVAAAEIWNL